MNQKFYFGIFFREIVLLRYLIIFVCGPCHLAVLATLFVIVYGFGFSALSFLKTQFLLEYSCFTMLCWFPLYRKVIQLNINIYPLFFGLPSHLGCYHRALNRVPCAIQQALKSWVSLKIENTLKKSRISHSFQRFVFSVFFSSSRIISNCFPLPSLGFSHADLHFACSLVVSFLSLKYS